MSVAQVTIERYLTSQDRRRALEHDVRTGLADRPKSLSPVWFYDARGSELFEEITRLPEYYLTRAERRLLEKHAPEIVDAAGTDTLVELGSGSSEKTRVLLDAMAATGDLKRYVALDVSTEALQPAVAQLRSDYPSMGIRGLVGDLTRHVARIPSDGRRLIAFLGSTIGNLLPDARLRFLSDVKAAMTPDDRMLLGVDLVKDRGRMVAAYDDGAGVTAEFNRNVLYVINRELAADFRPNEFDHVAVWNEREAQMEMHLVATEPTHAHIEALRMDVVFDAGEDILTEVSAKFTTKGVREELGVVGFGVQRTWTDGDYLLALAVPR